jgi:hypothetical protein
MDGARRRTLGVLDRVTLGQEEIVVVRDPPDSLGAADVTR